MGLTMSTLGPRPGFLSLASSFKIGKTNAAVLPVPVWADAKTCFPSMTSGIAFIWMGVAWV